MRSRRQSKNPDASSHLKHAAIVRVEVEGQGTWALIDSGADTSMISREFADSVIPKAAVQKGSFGSITQAGGDKIEVTGLAEVALSIQSLEFTQPMMIIPGLIYKIILGRDFCCMHNTILDDKAALFKIKGLHLPLPTYEELRPKKSRVITCSAVSIPARSRTTAYLKVHALDGVPHGPTEGKWQGVLEPCRSEEKHEWRVPRAVTNVKDDGTMPVHITNIGGHSLTIPSGVEVGTFHTIQTDGTGVYEISTAALTEQEAEPAERDKVIRELSLEEAAVSEPGKRVLGRLVDEYIDIFSKNDDDLGKTKLLKHHIDTGTAAPIRQRPRRIPLKLREEVERQKDKMLRDGIIEESSSPWCSPIVLAKKKDGSFRFCVDFRSVNAVTQSLPVPIPRIDESLDSLAGAKLFSTLDMAAGYWQMDLAEEDKEKTAFSTGKGLHQFRAMPFGLKNAGATFQRLMELVLAGVDSKSCLVYIDDVIVFGETEQAHLKNLEEVFQRIREAGMKLKPRKCCLARDQVVFLGHKVGRTGVHPDPANVEKVRNWPRPQRAEDLRSFLGLASFYSKFVPGYSDLVKPLREAAEKKGGLTWTAELLESFEKTKGKLTSPPVLTLPSFKGRFRLATDASNSAVGAVLTETRDGDDKVVAYASKVLNRSEKSAHIR